MNSDNNLDKWRDMFSDDTSELPGDFKWEDMEDGIMEKMKKEESRRPVFLIVFTILGCVLFLLGIGWAYIWNNNHAKTSKELEGIANTVHKHKTSESSDASMATIENETPKTLTNVRQSESKTNQNSEFSNIEIGKTVFKNYINRTTQKITISDNNSIPKTSDIIDINKISIEIGINNTQKENQTKTNEIITKSSSEKELENDVNLTLKSSSPNETILVESVNLLTAISLIKVNEIKSLEENLYDNVLSPTITDQKMNKIPNNYILLTGGITSWDLNYSKNAPERDVYEKTILSYHTQLSYTQRFKNNFVFGAGIRYQNLETELNYSTFIDNYKTIRLSDTIISIQTNAITGQQTRIKGDVDVNVSANRRIRHFNRYQVYQIPLSVGKAWSINKKWSTEISLGTAVNIYTYSKGRTLYLGDILDFSGSETPFINNRWGIQGLGSVKIHYKINNFLGLLLDGSIQQSLTNWSSEDGVSLLPLNKNIGLGMYYSY